MSELDIYDQQGFGGSAGFGNKPALLIVDFVNSFCDPKLFGGGNILDAVAATRDLLAVFRAAALPVAHTRVVYADDGADAGVMARKVPALLQLTEESPHSQIVEDLIPAAGEYVVRKTAPSAFFGTNLSAWLTYKGVDTVVVTGCTTSGCVRASVVDAVSHNFVTIVAEDGVGDRALEPHRANLFDMGQKYADVLSCTQIADLVGQTNSS